MAGTSAEAQVAKKCYKNQTAGWLGVVKVDHLGAQQGAPVEPFGTVYLSDEEAILTARAPANPKDNPFEEQTFMFADEQGQHVEQKMRPLILLSEDDEEGGSGERFVPTGDINPHTAAAEAARTEATLDAQADSPRTVATSVEEPTQVGSPVAAVDPAHSGPAPVEEPEADEEKGESWVENEQRTEEPQRGSLGGSNDHPGPDDADPAAGEGQRQQAPPPQAPVQQTVGSQAAPAEAAAAAEETAAAEGDSSLSVEETGAAVDPTGQAPEGEFAAHEEVGSPDAPAAEKGDAA